MMAPETLMDILDTGIRSATDLEALLDRLSGWSIPWAVHGQWIELGILAAQCGLAEAPSWRLVAELTEIEAWSEI